MATKKQLEVEVTQLKKLVKDLRHELKKCELSRISLIHNNERLKLKIDNNKYLLGKEQRRCLNESTYVPVLKRPFVLWCIIIFQFLGYLGLYHAN